MYNDCATSDTTRTWLLIDRGETAEAVVSAALQSNTFDCVLIGAGTRTVPPLFLLFDYDFFKASGRHGAYHPGDLVIEIRRADPSDHAALAAIRRSAILELAVAAMSTSQAEQWANRVAADRVTHAILHHAVWVAVQDVPIGWVEVDEDRVAALYVAPHCAGLGTGSRLLLHAEAAIRDGGHATARLESSPNAATFYLHRGYLPSEARTADGALPLSKRLPRHGPKPPLPPAGSAGG